MILGHHQNNIPLSPKIIEILRELKETHPHHALVLDEFLLALRHELECDHRCKRPTRELVNTGNGLRYAYTTAGCPICAVFKGERSRTVSLRAVSTGKTNSKSWRTDLFR